MPRWAGLIQAQALRPARQPVSPVHVRVCGPVGSVSLRVSVLLNVNLRSVSMTVVKDHGART